MVTLLTARPDTQSTRIERPIADDVPEFYHYEDTGCEASDSCLDCPLPMCRYDDPVWYQRNRRLANDFRVVQVIERENLSIDEASLRFGVAPRTVFRIMQRCREARMQAGTDTPMPLAA